MSGPGLIVVDSSRVFAGKLDDLKAVLAELVTFVEAEEADPLAYGVYFDEDGTRMTVVQVHPDSASMELHMRVAGPVFRKCAGLLQLDRVDFYGQPSEELLRLMRQKAELLGGAPVVVNALHEGFARFGAAAITPPPSRA